MVLALEEHKELASSREKEEGKGGEEGERVLRSSWTSSCVLERVLEFEEVYIDIQVELGERLEAREKLQLSTSFHSLSTSLPQDDRAALLYVWHKNFDSVL